MIDANILVYALSAPDPGRPAQVEAHAACSALVRGLGEVRISALAYGEVKRGIRGTKAEATLTAVRDLLSIEPMDAPAADFAAELMKQRLAKKGVCASCLQEAPVTACSRCGLPSSRAKRMSDLFIAAQAAVDAEVLTLYTYDGGILSLDGMLRQCTPKRPPNPHGPLFEGPANVVPLKKT